MAQDESDQTIEPPATAGRVLLFAGVAGACLLGVGAGLWARPHMNERQGMRPPAKVAMVSSPKKRTLQFVVDDRPAPLGDPIEVLPSNRAMPASLSIAPQSEEPMAPVRSPEGLVRVQAVLPIAPPVPAAAPVVRPQTPDPAIQQAKARRAAHTEARRIADRRAAAKAQEAAEARAEARAEAKAARLQQVREDRERAAELAKVRKAKTTAKPMKSTDRQVAKAETPRRPNEVARVAHALAKVVPHPSKSRQRALAEARAEKAEARKAKIALASLEKAKAEKARTQQAKLDRKKADRAKAQRLERERQVELARAAPRPKPSGLMRVSEVRRCASTDAGAALVCADPKLGAAERRMKQAYSQAQAAGVPEWRLRQQQQQWLAARAATAREAPWQVREVYLARIAELNDQTRSAEGGGY